MSDIPLVDSSARLVEGSTTPGLVTAENLILDALLKVVHKDSRGNYKLDADLCGGSEYTAADVLAKLVASGMTGVKCPDYGIGAFPTPKAGVDLNSLIVPGFYSCQSNSSHLPVDGGVLLEVIAYTSAYVIQRAWYLSNQNVIYGCIRATADGGATWTDNGPALNGWQRLDTQSFNMNGGQPPAPKPTNATPAGGANAPGKFIPINETSAYIIPGTASTYWLGIIICHVTSTGAVVAANSGGGIWAGGTAFTCGAGQTIQGFIWRQV